MPEREEIEINLKTTGDTSGAEKIVQKLKEVAEAQEEATKPKPWTPQSSAQETLARAEERRRLQENQPTIAPGQTGAFGVQMRIVRDAATEKTRIDKEYYANQAKDRLEAEKAEQATQSRLYDYRKKQTTDFAGLWKSHQQESQKRAQTQAEDEGRAYSRLSDRKQIGLTDWEKTVKQEVDLQKRFAPVWKAAAWASPTATCSIAPACAGPQKLHIPQIRTVVRPPDGRGDAS